MTSARSGAPTQNGSIQNMEIQLAEIDAALGLDGPGLTRFEGDRVAALREIRREVETLREARSEAGTNRLPLSEKAAQSMFQRQMGVVWAQLESYRTGVGLTYRGIAQKLNCAPSTLRRWRDGHAPSVRMVFRALRILSPFSRVLPWDIASALSLHTTLDLAALALRFGRVERATQHEDGRPETDTDHTIMLLLVAMELCPPTLDRERVLIYALIHDLVEATVGDTQTLCISEEGKRAQRAREQEALVHFQDRFGAGHWIPQSIAEYERQDSDEARFVHILDKLLPKLTAVLNHGRAAKRIVPDVATLRRLHQAQYEEFAAILTADWSGPILALLRAAMDATEATYKEIK